MAAFPDPVWLVIALALCQLVDGLMCVKPLPFIAQCFRDVGFPQRWWWLPPVLKFASVAGLIAGIWIPYLGAVTSVALVAYFIIAITMHIRARDFSRTLFVNATGMLILCVAVMIFAFMV